VVEVQARTTRATGLSQAFELHGRAV